MKQQILIGQHDSSQNTPQSRKQKLQKKRMIRKNKTLINMPQIDLRSIDTSLLSREQKARIQKVKNREAAQKSRDMHREYVTNLQRQIKELRQSINCSRRICWKCQRQVQQSSTPDSSQSDQHTDERSKQQRVFSFEKEDEAHESNLQHFQHFQQESFMRAQDSSNSMSYMKMMLFVSMIVIAIICIGSASKPESIAPTSRALMEIPQQPTNKIQQKQAQENKINKTQTAIVPIQKGLIALNTDDCLNSLMTVEESKQNKKSSLRTYHDNSASQTYLANQQGILLCTVRSRKTYESRYQKLRSPLVRLYLLGSQIKQMLAHSSLLIPIRDSNIQINGLYRVAAQIKDVNLVSDHNCLL